MASFDRSRTGTRPTRSNSLRGMMLNSASPLPDATAPITADELLDQPGDWGLHHDHAAFGQVKPGQAFQRWSRSLRRPPALRRLSVLAGPAEPPSPPSERRIPETSTIAEKHCFAALRTVTAAPFGAPASSAARDGCEAKQNPASTAVASFPKRPRRARWLTRFNPISALSISEG